MSPLRFREIAYYTKASGMGCARRALVSTNWIRSLPEWHAARYTGDAMSTNDERPLADPGRTEIAVTMFSEGLSPEEFAARSSHTILCFSLDECRYADPALDAWISRLGAILFQRNGAPTVTEFRERILSPEERFRVEVTNQEDF